MHFDLREVGSMRSMRVLFALFAAFCFVGVANVYAIDPGECEYIDDDDPQVDDNGYIMSWLILDPYISDTAAPAAMSTVKDYFEDQGGEADIMPREGEEVTIAETKSDHVWTRLNFADLVDMKQLGAAVGGNEFDILCWGGQGPTNTQEYMVTYLKWKSDTTATFTIGADDGAELYFNGEEVMSCPVDQDWGAANCGTGKASAKGGEWNVVVVGAYETGGEWGITVRVDPIPDEVNNIGPPELFAVEAMDKLPITWGKIKD
jgi:hypothetical protein